MFYFPVYGWFLEKFVGVEGDENYGIMAGYKKFPTTMPFFLIISYIVTPMDQSAGSLGNYNHSLSCMYYLNDISSNG